MTLATAALMAVAVLSVPATASIDDPLDAKPKAELERLKVAAEVEKLRNENARAGGWSGFFTAYAPFLTALVAVGGLLATIWKQSSDQSAQRTRDREERVLESNRRLDDRFATILTELGADAQAVRAGAAASLPTFLRLEHRRFHHQVRLAVLTNLKLDHGEPIRKLLARVYDASLRTPEPIEPMERDLSRAQLARTDLSGIDLQEADLAFADLRNASVRGSNLYRALGLKVQLAGARVCADDRGTGAFLVEVRFQQASCQGADFSNAVLVNAHLKEAQMQAARFYQARMQAAHLEGANLVGAQFQMANLADTYFTAAIFDDVALRSIVRARNWRKAHFDREIRDELERLARELN